MKKITFLIVSVFAFALSFTAQGQCNYTLEMNDSWGDGWNGNTMDVLVNGAVVLDDVTFNNGEQFAIPFTVNDGDEITTVWNGGGGFPGETSYRILDFAGVSVGNAAQTGITTPIVVVCPACDVPQVSFAVVTDCPNSTNFSIEVTISDIGSASGVTISDDQATTPLTGLTAGTYTFGDYLNATNVIITVANEDDGTCSVPSSSLTFAGVCPPVNDTCNGAIPVNCNDTVTGTTALASGATDTGGNPARDVWYSFNGGGTPQDVTLDLCASSYDTLIRVYDACSGTQIAVNDDGCGTRSRLTFGSDGATTYYIMVEGFGSSSGAFELSVSCSDLTPPPANNECVDAIALSTGVTVEGTTSGATQNLDEEQPTCDLFGTIADVWYTVTLNSISDLTITTTITGTSDQANIAVYSACGGLQADELACSDGNAGESVSGTALDAGTYYIRVWSDGATSRIAGTFDIVADITLSDNDVFSSETAFSYYPNPTNDVVTLKAQNTIQNVAVYNVVGQQVMSTSPNALESNLDLTSLRTGAYFVQVTINDITKTVRVIKQ